MLWYFGCLGLQTVWLRFINELVTVFNGKTIPVIRGKVVAVFVFTLFSMMTSSENTQKIPKCILIKVPLYGEKEGDVPPKRTLNTLETTLLSEVF